MIYFLKNITITLNFVIFICFIAYIFFFKLKIGNEFLSNFIIIISIITFFFKFLYWYLNSKFIKIINFSNKSFSLLLRLGMCIFLYITPSYYIIEKENLIISDYIILITLIIISILILIGILIEQYLFNFEKDHNQKQFNEEN